MSVDASMVLAGLEELDRRWPDRVAWSAAWQESCVWFAEEARALGADLEVDRAGNQWLSLRGTRDDVVVVGGHLDAGPGCETAAENLGALGGLEVLRRLAAEGPPPVTVKLVNWVDGAGVRFGRPFGAAAAAGTMRDWEAAAQLVDRYGSSLNDVVESAGLMFKLVHMARRMLGGAKAYLELGVEPGEAGPPLRVVADVAGIERCRVRWADPAGGDARPAAELFEAEVQADAASRLEREVFAERAVVQLLDQRAIDGAALEQLLDDALEASDRIATGAGLSVAWQRIWAAAPVALDRQLSALAASTLDGAELGRTQLQSAAAELARGGFPAALLVLRSQEDVELGVESLDRVVRAVLAR